MDIQASKAASTVANNLDKPASGQFQVSVSRPVGVNVPPNPLLLTSAELSGAKSGLGQGSYLIELSNATQKLSLVSTNSFKPGTLLQLRALTGGNFLIIEPASKQISALTTPIVSQLSQLLPLVQNPQLALKLLNFLSQQPELSTTLKPLIQSVTDQQQVTHPKQLQQQVQQHRQGQTQQWLENGIAMVLLAIQQAASPTNPAKSNTNAAPSPLLQVLNTWLAANQPGADKTLVSKQPWDIPQLGQMTTPNLSQNLSQNDKQAALGLLLKLLNGGLQKIQLQQLNQQLDYGINRTPPLLIELPFQDEQGLQLLQLRIEQRQQGHQQSADEQSPEEQPNAKKAQWWLTLGFELTPLSALYAKVGMLENKIEAHFYTTDPALLAQINQHLPVLAKSLEQYPIEVTALDAQQGQPQHDGPILHQQMVDVRT